MEIYDPNLALISLPASSSLICSKVDWGGGSMFLGLKFLKKNLRVLGIKKVLQKRLLSCIFAEIL